MHIGDTSHCLYYGLCGLAHSVLSESALGVADNSRSRRLPLRHPNGRLAYYVLFRTREG